VAQCSGVRPGPLAAGWLWHVAADRETLAQIAQIMLELQAAGICRFATLIYPHVAATR